MGVQAERTDAETSEVSIDYSTYLDAYECNPNDLSSVVANNIYSQGSILTICVKGDPGIVIVDSIKDLTVKQENTVPFVYITNTDEFNSAIVQVECSSDINRICSAQLRLLGRFFTLDNPENLEVTGSVTLSFPERLLSSSLTELDYGDFLNTRSRSLQDISDSGLFDIQVELGKNEDAATNHSVLSSDSKCYISSDVVYFVGLVFVIL